MLGAYGNLSHIEKRECYYVVHFKYIQFCQLYFNIANFEEKNAFTSIKFCFKEKDEVGIGDMDGRIEKWGEGDGSNRCGETLQEPRLFHHLEVTHPH